MIKRIFAIGVVALAMISCNEQKTAYVDTTKIIQEYKEMKEVEASFTSKSDSVRRELDVAAQAFQQEVQAYQAEMNSMSVADKQAKEQELMQKQQMLQQQQQMRSGVLREESTAVMDSMVNKVKDFVKQYGEDNGYTYIFGSNESASIMYAEDGLDITEEVLEKMNNSYSGNSTTTIDKEVDIEEVED